MKSSLGHPATTLIIKHLVCCAHIIGSLFFASCQSDAELHETRFTALSESETGISFINTNKEDGDHNILLYEYFYNGGGVAAGDINNDGLTDLYFTSNQGENKLYLNKGDLRFEDITRQAGVEARDGWKTGVTMVDINADGYLDIYVSKSGELPPSSRRNLLFINNKDLTFTEQAGKYWLDDNSYTTQTAFFDYDRDGDLDAFLLNHSRLTISNSFDIGRRNSNQRVAYVGNKLYRNDGARFVDVSDSLGVFGPASNYGLGVGFADIDRDGWPDIYTSNDYTGKDKLLLNKKGKIFHEVSDSLFTHLSQFSMGVDIADVNNDGMDDVFTLDMLPETNKRQKELLWPNKYDVYSAMVKNGLHHQFMRNMLQLNNGDGTFTEVGQFAGVSNTDWSWAPLIADFDLDGLQDIFVSNGFKREFINNDFLKYKADLLIKVKRGQKFDKIEDIVQKMPSNKVHNYIYRNKDGITFQDESVAWGFGEENLTNGAAYADLDNDGDLDLVTNQLDQRSVIYRNNSADFGKQQFIKVRAIGNDGNSLGLGAVVNIYSKHIVMTRTLNPSRGFQSSVEPLLFFGLDSVKVVDSLTITWPRGEFQVIRNVQSNQLIKVYQKDATFKSAPVKKIIPAYSRVDNAIPFQHRENDFVDFRVQPLLPRTYSASGPAVASADVNGDGRIDLYFGGAKDQQGVLLLQASDGKFVPRTVNDFSAARQAEEVDAVFFDMDNDGDKDLYVVTGGYEFPAGSPLLFDLLYANDGHGNFTTQTLPGISAHGSCVRPADVDRDGDLDLFIGGRISNGRYPEPVESFLLINDGRGKFMKSSAVIEGMVTDAAWLDVNSDQWPDLVVVGEWMPVKVMINNGGKLIDKSADFIDEHTDGWWNKIISADFDKDGDMDLVVGNFGMNNQFRPTIEHPATMRYGDFDGNGSVDPMMSYYIVDQSYPSATRDELIDQLPSLRKSYNDYASYSLASTSSLINEDDVKKMKTLSAYTMESSYFTNVEGKFRRESLPPVVQIAPIFALDAIDVNHDGNLDILTGGNLHKMGPRFGLATGNFGTVLLGDGHGGFTALSSKQSGITVRGEVRSIIHVGEKIIYIRNNDSPLLYRPR